LGGARYLQRTRNTCDCLQVEKTWQQDALRIPKQEVKSQKRKRLVKKRDLKDEKETADSAKRTQYATFEAIPLYTTVADLRDEMESCFPAAGDIPARPRYSTALKTAIVREQLNARKWVYGRKFPEGFLLSGSNDSSPDKLKKLLQTFSQVVQEEAKDPPVKKPPSIRAYYTLGPNSTKFRRSLDDERNKTTKDLEATFLENHPGMVFKGTLPSMTPTPPHTHTHHPLPPFFF